MEDTQLMKLHTANQVGGCLRVRQHGEFLVLIYMKCTLMYYFCHCIPNRQMVCVHPYERLDMVGARGDRARTPLTEFFAINATTENGKGYSYVELCEHYRWDTSAKAWFKRKKTKKIVIGRIAFVSPVEGERFFLRLLLLNVRSPRSFDDLRTVGGHVCASFQEAAYKLGILEEDDAANVCLSEACEMQLPVALRRLFAIILIFCHPSNPSLLWQKYYPSLSEDFVRQYLCSESKIKQLTIRSIEQHLEAMGKSLEGCGFGELNEMNDNEIRIIKDILDALEAPIPQECIESRSCLNTAQKEAFHCIMQHIIEEKPSAFFIDGSGGTKKIFLYNALYAEIRLMNKIVLPTATSSIAATNIPSGPTAHSRFKIPIDNESMLTCIVSKQSSLAALIKEH